MFHSELIEVRLGVLPLIEVYDGDLTVLFYDDLIYVVGVFRTLAVIVPAPRVGLSLAADGD